MQVSGALREGLVVAAGVLVGASGVVSGALAVGLFVAAGMGSVALGEGLAADTRDDSVLRSCAWADPASRPVTSDPWMSVK